MAQEEKLEEAKRLYETANADQRYVLESLFPELKESEDERTRESLLEYLHTLPNHYTHSGVCVLEWIAWIEKQAQKPVWSEEDKNMLEWVIGYLDNKMLNTPISEERTACKNAIDWLEEKLKGEQKPAEQNVDNRKLCNIVIEELSKYSGNEADKAPWALDSTGVQYPLYFAELGVKWQKEQNPTWSEEDERMCKAIIDNIKAICKEGYFVGNIGSDKLIDWLISLKDRVQPQQKQEWSEEDDIWLNNLICHFETGLSIEHERVASWLKSLKERYAWKPSDEQIKALETTLYTNMSRNDERYLVLSEFVAELKKLREE